MSLREEAWLREALLAASSADFATLGRVMRDNPELSLVYGLQIVSHVPEVVPPRDYRDFLPDVRVHFCWFIDQAKRIEARTGSVSRSKDLLAVAIELAANGPDAFVRTKLEHFFHQFTVYEHFLCLLIAKARRSPIRMSVSSVESDFDVAISNFESKARSLAASLDFSRFEQFWRTGDLTGLDEEKPFLHWLGRRLLAAENDLPPSVVVGIARFLESETAKAREPSFDLARLNFRLRNIEGASTNKQSVKQDGLSCDWSSVDILMPILCFH